MKLLTINQASELCGISRWQYQKYTKAGIAPKPIDKGDGSTAYLYSEAEVLKKIEKINAYTKKLAKSSGRPPSVAMRKSFDKVINTHADKVFDVFNKIARR